MLSSTVLTKTETDALAMLKQCLTKTETDALAINKIKRNKRVREASHASRLPHPYVYLTDKSFFASFFAKTPIPNVEKCGSDATC